MMTICIKREGLTLPVSPVFAFYITNLLTPYESAQAVTINFKDLKYTVDDGGYHPVEIRLEKDGEYWCFSYITDFCYVGSGYCAEFAKDLDFDFGAGVFQNLFGIYPIEQGIDMYQIWESNFIYYAMISKAFEISFSREA